MIKQKIRVGGLVWIEQCLASDLPEGLENGARARVTRYDSVAREVTVTNGTREWTVDPVHIDTGWIFQTGSGYFGEDTPKGRMYLNAEIAGLKAGPDHPRFPELRSEKISFLQGILSRSLRKAVAA